MTHSSLLGYPMALHVVFSLSTKFMLVRGSSSQPRTRMHSTLSTTRLLSRLFVDVRSETFVRTSIECALDRHPYLCPRVSPLAFSSNARQLRDALLTRFPFEGFGTQICRYLVDQFPDLLTVEFPFHKWEQILVNGRYHLSKACGSKRMEPTVVDGKDRFHVYWGMGKLLSLETVIGLCMLAHGPHAFDFVAAALKYVFRELPCRVFVRNFVNPDAKDQFSALFDRLARSFLSVGLEPPVAFSSEVVDKLNLDIHADTCHTESEKSCDDWIHAALDAIHWDL